MMHITRASDFQKVFEGVSQQDKARPGTYIITIAYVLFLIIGTPRCQTCHAGWSQTDMKQCDSLAHINLAIGLF